MNIVILDKPAHKCFSDIAEVVSHQKGEGTVCFGVNDWTQSEIEEVFKSIEGKKICFQLEVLNGKTYYSNEQYIFLLKQFDEVWDYSLHNFEFLEKHHIHPVYFPVESSVYLKEEELERKIDVLHIGWLNEHRVEYLNYAIENDIDMFDVSTVYKRDVWGEEIHQLIRQSKVVLGLHSFPEMPIQESVRYQYPLSNNIQVLAEKSLSNPLNLVEFTTKEEMVIMLKQLLRKE